ncbi:MAG TPA: alpha/beta fold hydrolase [Reyranella sp.]|nr:alpha/beta fold hydrolase [Reyranella sp.]
MPSPLDIVLHTPLWVWPLLALVVWLGWWARRPRAVRPLRLAALPLVGIGVTVAGALHSAAPGVTLAGWLVGLLISLPVGHAVGRRRAVVRQEDGRLWIAGGWFVLAFALSIFIVRYALGVTFGVWPELGRRPLWIAVAGLAGGVIAGMGLGWLSGLLWRGSGLRRSLLAGAALPVLATVAFAAMIAFDAPARLPPLAAANNIPGIETWNFAELPPVKRVAARDDAPLAYRLYPGRADRAVVLVHGSSGASISMHKVAQALQAAGATVYSISLRGHGGSGTVNGDVSYRNQPEDDLVDFVQAVGLDDPKIHRTLVGFSLGGGFVLRVASGPQAGVFDAYVAVSPYIAQDAPTSRQGSGGWASVAVPRAIGLSLLDAFGLPWFQGLPVVRFATDAPPSDSRTPVYSYRLLASLQPHRTWRADIARITRPMMVVVGSTDELFYADRFGPLFAELNPKIAVSVTQGVGHMGIIADPRGTAAIAGAWQKLAGSPAPRRAERFDMKVREDMFAGFDGDKEAFKRAMALIDRTLAADPNHAQALTWRGSGRMFLAGQAFRRGATAEGLKLQGEGLDDLDRGVALENSIATHAARGPVLMNYASFVRPYDKTFADKLTATAIADFEFIVARNAANWAALGSHDRGELLGALATGWLQLDKAPKAAPYLERMISELPNTPYARAATARRADASSKTPLTCLGCH